MPVTFENVKLRIADELLREDINPQIDKAVKSAIKYYQSTPFWFNEAVETITDTVYSDASIAVGTNYDAEKIQYIELLESGSVNHRFLKRLHWEEYLRLVDEASLGEPTAWASYANVIYLYPKPDKTYQFKIYYIQSNDVDLLTLSDSHVFLNNAEELIRYRAKWDLCLNVLSDYNAAEGFKQSEIEALSNIKRETTNRVSTGSFRPTEF